MSGFSASHFHLIITSELQKPSCSFQLVGKEESADFQTSVGWCQVEHPLVPVLQQNYPVTSEHTVPQTEKFCQVNLQAYSRDVLCVHNTKEKQDAMESKPPAHSHVQEARLLLAFRQKAIPGGILFFLFKQFTTTNRYLRDIQQLGDSHLIRA